MKNLLEVFFILWTGIADVMGSSQSLDVESYPDVEVTPNGITLSSKNKSCELSLKYHFQGTKLRGHRSQTSAVSNALKRAIMRAQISPCIDLSEPSQSTQLKKIEAQVKDVDGSEQLVCSNENEWGKLHEYGSYRNGDTSDTKNQWKNMKAKNSWSGFAGKELDLDRAKKFCGEISTVRANLHSIIEPVVLR
jgi:hypothetical protein